jgi:hypothetical protein
MAKPRGTPNLPVNYAEQLAKESAEIAKRIAAPTGDRIRFNQNRSFITPDGHEGETIDVVIADFVSANLFYDRQYDRDNPAPPGCFADTCSSCPNNQFGSAANGKGKACKNTRSIAVMPAAALDSPDQEAPIWILSVPPTSLKAFDGYVAQLSSKYKTVPVGVITRLTLDPQETYASPRFAVVRPLQGNEFATFMPRREEATTRLMTEPDVSQYTPPPAGRGVGVQNRSAPVGGGTTRGRR